MWRVGFWNRKGGCGKTSLCASVSVAASADGSRIAVIDGDPQGSLSAWSEVREAASPVVVAVPLVNLGDALESAAADGYDAVFVDFPGSLGALEQRALGLVDLVVIPCRPTGLDLHATLASLKVAEGVGVRTAAVLSMVRTRGRETLDVRETLAGIATVFPTEIRELIAFQNAVSAGLGVTEYEPGGSAATEIENLLADIRRTVNG